jgi:hypothetical protein
MSNFVWPSLGLFFLLTVLLAHQENFSKQFSSEDPTFKFLLTSSRFAGAITGLSYMVFYGWHISWWVALLLVLVLFAAGIVALFTEKLTPKVTKAALWAWPICAYFMFKLLLTDA